MKNLILTNATISSREIATITAKQHKNLMRDIRAMEPAWEKVNRLKFELVEYKDAKGELRPEYLLNKEECFYIATKFNDEARAMLIKRWKELEIEKAQPKSTLDVLSLTIEAMREQEAQLAEIKADVKQLKATTQTRLDYFTIVGFGILHHVKLNLTIARTLGKKASKMCRKTGCPIDKIREARFGKVNLYPEEVLKEVFRIYNII